MYYISTTTKSFKRLFKVMNDILSVFMIMMEKLFFDLGLICDLISQMPQSTSMEKCEV